MPVIVTDCLLDLLPTPAAIQFRLNETLALADQLRSLLALSEQVHKADDLGNRAVREPMPSQGPTDAR